MKGFSAVESYKFENYIIFILKFFCASLTFFGRLFQKDLSELFGQTFFSRPSYVVNS